MGRGMARDWGGNEEIIPNYVVDTRCQLRNWEIIPNYPVDPTDLGVVSLGFAGRFSKGEIDGPQNWRARN